MAIDWVAATAIGAMGYAATMHLIASRRAHERRVAEMQRCSAALQVHGENMREVFDSPDVPEELKVALSGFSDAMENHQLVLKIGQDLLKETGGNFRHTNSTNSTNARFAELEDRDPAMAQRLMLAITSGLIAGFNRWHDTAETFAKISTLLVMEPKRSIEVATSVAFEPEQHARVHRQLAHA